MPTNFGDVGRIDVAPIQPFRVDIVEKNSKRAALEKNPLIKLTFFANFGSTIKFT